MKVGKEIIEEILQVLNVTPYAISKELEYNRTQTIYDVVSGKTKKISGDMANRIVSKYPQFNLSWLLTGEGEMLKTEYNAGRDIINGDNNKTYSSSGANNKGLIGENSGTYVAVNGDLEGKKIIDGKRIEIKQESNAEELLLQKIASLEAEITRLEGTIKSKDETIEAHNRTIESQKDTIFAKNEMIQYLKNKK